MVMSALTNFADRPRVWVEGLAIDGIDGTDAVGGPIANRRWEMLVRARTSAQLRNEDRTAREHLG